jgi:hypothetical protein
MSCLRKGDANGFELISADDPPGHDLATSTRLSYTRRLSDKVLIAFHHACDAPLSSTSPETVAKSYRRFPGLYRREARVDHDAGSLKIARIATAVPWSAPLLGVVLGTEPSHVAPAEPADTLGWRKSIFLPTSLISARAVSLLYHRLYKRHGDIIPSAQGAPVHCAQCAQVRVFRFNQKSGPRQTLYAA